MMRMIRNSKWALAAAVIATGLLAASCFGTETPPPPPVAGLTISGEGVEFDAPVNMSYHLSGPSEGLVIYARFNGGKSVVLKDPEGNEFASFTVPAAKDGVCRLCVDGSDGSYELVRIKKVSLVVAEGSVDNPKAGKVPPIEAEYAGAGKWKVNGLWIARDYLRYRFELETDTPASLKYWCATWDNAGAAPSAHSTGYLQIRELGQEGYDKAFLKPNRACWMFPADRTGMLADFTLSMNAQKPVQEIAYTTPHKGPRAVFIGDSITWQWARASRTDARSNLVIPLDPLPSFMTASGENFSTRFHPAFFTSNDYINRGVSGENTTQMVARYQADVLDMDPSCVVIMGGTNDLAQGYAKDRILANLASMAEQAAAEGMKVILCSVTPCNDVYSRLENPNTKGAHIIALNQMIKNYADSQGFTYCDYWTSLVASDGLSMREEFWLYDALHPNPDGYDVMEAIIQPIIDALLTP